MKTITMLKVGFLAGIIALMSGCGTMKAAGNLEEGAWVRLMKSGIAGLKAKAISDGQWFGTEKSKRVLNFKISLMH